MLRKDIKIGPATAARGGREGGRGETIFCLIPEYLFVLSLIVRYYKEVCIMYIS